MADAGVRVVLLARAGSARDHLHRALSELGATLVAEGDPAELDPAQVAGQSPNLILVSLEPAIEAALEHFDELLATPGIEVMYDDAEVTRQLEGWDLNRWARHLATKLLGHDPLPPTPGDADPVPDHNIAPVPGLPPTPAELMDGEKLEDYAQDAVDLADWVPVNPSLTQAGENSSEIVEPGSTEEEISFDFDLGDLDQALKEMDAAASASDPAQNETSVEPDTEFSADADFDIEVDLSSLDQQQDTSAGIDFKPESKSEFDDSLPEADSEPLLADVDFSAEPVRFSSFDEQQPAHDFDELDADVAALAAQLDAFENAQPKEQVRDPDFALVLDDAPASVTAAASAPALEESAQAPAIVASSGGSDFSNLSLVGMDEVIATTRSSGAPTTSLFSSSTLTLAPIDGETETGHHESAAHESIAFAPTVQEPAAAQEPIAGVVAIFAGLGGPDAVRQLVSSLPEKLPVPVLLYQHLEVGKHERLVDQLGKISRLPVILAEDGVLAQPGKVNVLPAGLTASCDGILWRFAAGPLRQMIDALAAESVVVMLSGADPDLVPSALALRDNGGLALAQDPELCFDPVAAQAMSSQGAAVYPALGLARQIAARWSL